VISIATQTDTIAYAAISRLCITDRWARPDISRRSGLAALEVHIPTGYVVTNDVLRRYVQSGEVPTLRRAERYARKVVFYFDYVRFKAV